MCDCEDCDVPAIFEETGYVRLEQDIGHSGSEEGRVYWVRAVCGDEDYVTLTKVGKVGRYKGRPLKFTCQNEMRLFASEFTDDGRHIVDGTPKQKLFTAVPEEERVSAQQKPRSKRTVEAMFGREGDA